MHINLLTFPVLSISTTHCTLYCIFGTSQGAKIKVARVYRAFYFTELPVYTQAYLSNLGHKLETHFCKRVMYKEVAPFITTLFEALF